VAHPAIASVGVLSYQRRPARMVMRGQRNQKPLSVATAGIFRDLAARMVLPDIGYPPMRSDHI